MKIGIDISQIAYEKTGVANYLRNLVKSLVVQDSKNDYILFYSSMRRDLGSKILGLGGPQGPQRTKNKKQKTNVEIKQFKIPPTVLDILWNRLHVAPIEWFIGDVDVFITSDWTEPPAKRAKKATILYDLIVHKYPEETDQKIVDTQKRKLQWIKKESDMVFCISKSTAKDAEEILGIPKDKLEIIYPGI
jgi:hypothetical protein